jgi:hypothetical protein
MAAPEIPPAGAPEAAPGGGQPEGDSLEDIGKWLGLLLGGLAGAFSFLGIQGEEVSAILRNQRWEASAIALMLAAALSLSIASLFLGRVSMPGHRAAAIGALVLALSPLMVFSISTSRLEENRWHKAVLGVAVALVIVAFDLWALPWLLRHVRRLVAIAIAFACGALGMGLAIRFGMNPTRWWPYVLLGLLVVGVVTVAAVLALPWLRGRSVPARLVALLVGVLLIETAVYSGLRLETRSQFRTTSPQVSASYVTTDAATKVKLDVHAERLRADDDMAIEVSMVPRTAKAPSRRDMPCLHGDCTFVAGAQLRPDAFGTIDESYEFPVDPQAAQHVSIVATLCLRDRPSADDGCPNRRQTLLDVEVPEPPPTTTATTR